MILIKNRKTEKQKNRKTEKQKNRKTEKQKNRKTEKQKNRKTENNCVFPFRKFVLFFLSGFTSTKSYDRAPLAFLLCKFYESCNTKEGQNDTDDFEQKKHLVQKKKDCSLQHILGIGTLLIYAVKGLFLDVLSCDIRG
ncbi:hypothetical protein [Bartonella doshiae]|uniref:hypothetical protein n=1 Tax=Bartonella doshiae TaxID=33044 RepID=UPI001ABB6283|nr:hypothetical protein [Bartonella doshiae]